MESLTEEQAGGLNRRDVLRRGAILGGALVWTVPAVQTLSGPAFATGTPCVGECRYTDSKGQCFVTSYQPSTGCCDCVTTYVGQGLSVPTAAAICEFTGKCVGETRPC